jgi:hypothetical protein
MADNMSVTPGTGTSVATDDIGGVHYQRVKLAWGVDGSAADASAAAPLPVADATAAAYLATLAAADPAHDAPDSGSPVKIGGIARAGLSGETLVAAGDRVNGNFSRDGAQFVRAVPLGDLLSGVAAVTDGSSTSVIAAQGAGLKTYVTGIVIANSSGTAVTVDLRDGAAGSVRATFPVPAGGGAALSLGDTPLAFSANTAVCADPSAAASTVTVTLIGFKSAL